MPLTRKFLHSLLVVTVTAGACGYDRGTAPYPVSFDASQALARVEPIAVIFDQPIFASFRGAEGFFETFFRSAAPASVSPAPSMSAQMQLGSSRSLTVAGQQSSASTIPDDLKGKTFVWDSNARTYVVDPTTAGALPSGVRYILYVWDSVNGPALPLTRIGYVDIAPPDGADASADEFEVIVERDVPRAIVGDFVVTHRASAGVNKFDIDGSATDTRTVALIALNGTEQGAPGQHHLVFNTNLSSSPAGVDAIEQLVSDQAAASQTGKLELDYDGHRFTDESVSGGADIKFDGNLYAHLLFPTAVSDQVRYLRSDGTSLSSQEIADLNALLDRVIVANFFWINLAFP